MHHQTTTDPADTGKLKPNDMKKQTAHLIESLSHKYQMKGKYVRIVLRSAKDSLDDRPNCFLLTRGKNGWTKCEQESYYYNLSKQPNGNTYVWNGIRDIEELGKRNEYHKVDYREYTDIEIEEILNNITIVNEVELTRNLGVYNLF